MSDAGTCKERSYRTNHEGMRVPVVCCEPATTTYGGRPMCEGHRENAENRERETIAETFTDGVPIEELRKIAAAGGLKALLGEVERLKAENARLGVIETALLSTPLLTEAEMATDRIAAEEQLRQAKAQYEGVVMDHLGHEMSVAFGTHPAVVVARMKEREQALVAELEALRFNPNGHDGNEMLDRVLRIVKAKVQP